VGRLCTICTHAQRQDIDAALMVHAASYHKLAQRFEVGYTALFRHEQDHLRHSLKMAKEVGEVL
jgi:hypothetical protein